MFHGAIHLGVKNLSLFQVKYKKEKGIFAIHVVSKSGNHLFSKIPFSLNS
jgi:hypothetical protein